MPQYEPPSNYGSLGAFLVVIGICSLCGGAIQGFGDRDPHPSPEIKAQFEEIDHRMGWMILAGAILFVSGSICLAASVSSDRIDWRNQKRD